MAVRKVPLALAKRAKELRAEVERRDGLLREEWKTAADALTVALEAVTRAVDVGEEVTPLRHELAAAENVLNPSRRSVAGRFRLHPTLLSLYLGGEQAVRWLRACAGEGRE